MHFPNVDGEQIAIENTVHLTSDHVGAASQSGWALLEMHERLIDDEWIAALPNMARYARRPVSFVMYSGSGAHQLVQPITPGSSRGH